MHLNTTYSTNIIIQQLRRWITCLVLVTFDLDQGQKVQYIVPDIQFNQQSIKELAMLSFPDSNSFNDYENSFKYTFRMYNGVYGYSCFKQKKDPKNARGFSQRSFVILSELPFVNFFQKLAEFIVFKTFNSVEIQDFPAVMVKICQQICKWPDPTPKTQYIVPILQYQLSIKIPNYKYSKQRSIISSQQQLKRKQTQKNLLSINLSSPSNNYKQYNLQTILSQEQLQRQGPFQQLKLCQVFINCHEVLWGIWQKIMLNKSILILGSNPQQVSHAVLGGVSLIYPFQYCGYFNPYVTVYDPNIDKISSQKKNWISGGSNPLFNKFFNKQIVQIIPLDKTYKCPKNLKPSTEILIKSTSQQQQAINQSVIRKYFYQLSKSVMLVLDTYLIQQTNDLKFFNNLNFIKWIKERKDFFGIQDLFSNRKNLLEFFQAFIESANFNLYLTNRNAIKHKAK